MTERNEVLEFLEEMLHSDEELRREAEKERVRLQRALVQVRALKKEPKGTEEKEEE